jgi:hypothetical protein
MRESGFEPQREKSSKFLRYHYPLIKCVGPDSNRRTPARRDPKNGEVASLRNYLMK